MNVSTTRGLSVDGSSPEKVGINASSTLAFDSSGKVYVNPNFYLPLTSNVTSTFNATSTFNYPVFITATSTISKLGPFLGPTEVTNKLYQDLQSTTATGTSAQAITAGKSIFMTVTSTLALTAASGATTTSYFVGLAEETVGSAAVVRYTKPGGTNCFQSGLTVGASYYLSDTAGTLATTPGTLFARVGIATSANCIQVSAPRYMTRGATAISATGNTIVTLGYYPARIEIRATSANANGGISIGDDTNRTIAAKLVGATNVGSYVNDHAWYVYDANAGTVRSSGTVSTKTAVNFTFNTDTYAAGTGNTQLLWTAFSE